jgi:hypothetical protein
MIKGKKMEEKNYNETSKNKWRIMKKKEREKEDEMEEEESDKGRRVKERKNYKKEIVLRNE